MISGGRGQRRRGGGRLACPWNQGPLQSRLRQALHSQQAFRQAQFQGKRRTTQRVPCRQVCRQGLAAGCACFLWQGQEAQRCRLAASD